VGDVKGGSWVLGMFTQIWQRLDQGWQHHFFSLTDCYHSCKDAQLLPELCLSVVLHKALITQIPQNGSVFTSAFPLVLVGFALTQLEKPYQ